MKSYTRKLFVLALSSLSIFFAVNCRAATTVPTVTTLKATEGGSGSSSVVSGTVITLTAKVKSGSAAITTGQVEFCDASAPHCTDIHLLGTAQLTSAGTAVMRFVPGIGKHSYKAVFLGTPNGMVAYATSASAELALPITGKFPTTTEVSDSGAVGDYSLTATVTGLVNSSSLAAPAGKVSFLDTTSGNHLLGKATLGASTLGLQFLDSNSLTTSPAPQSLAVGDFNGDGNLDMAVAVYGAVNIFLGNGDGTFRAGPTFPLADQNVNNAAVGDFNGDGNPDLVISLPETNEVQAFLGMGDGSFTALTPVAVPYVFSVSTADLNGDGKADLIVGGYEVSVLLGNGDGTFALGTSISITGGGVALSVGDFNGDSIPDLAVVNNSGSANTKSSVNILLGKGDGTFTELSKSPKTGIEPMAIVTGDFNGDGILDLAVANQNGENPKFGTVTMLIGKGDGTFAPTAKSPVTAIAPTSIAIADFNGDGKADLMTANAGSNNASVSLGNGDGTFSAPLNPPVGSGPLGAVVGDFNGDGLADFATSNNRANSVTVLLTAETQTTSATLTSVAPKGLGQHLVDATYSGSANYLGSVSPTISLTGSPTAP